MYRTVQFILAITIAAVLLFTMPAFSQGTGNIGFSFSQVIDDQSIGLIGEYEYAAESYDFKVEGQLQSGDVYRGKSHAEIVFDISKIDVKLAADTTAKGYTLETLGRDTNFTVGLTVPVKSFDVEVGMGGNSSAPWGAPNALNDLVPKGYDQSELEALGLQNVHPAPRGIPFRDGASVNTYIATGFDRHGIEVDAKGVLQLTGEDKAHQIITYFETSKNLMDRLTATIGAEVAVMAYQNKLHSEVAIFSGLGYKW